MACNNMFLEDDNFCTVCGKVHGTKKPEIKREKTQVEKVNKIQSEISANPTYRAAKETAELLINLYGLNCKVIFRNNMGAYFTTKYTNPVIVFGYQRLDLHEKVSYKEYVSLQYLIPSNLTGADAAKVIAAHEVAHATVNKNNLREYGDCHGSDFVTVYKELLSLIL